MLNYEQVIVNGLKVSVGDPVRTMADTDYYDDKGGAEDDIENTWVGTVEELWGWENSTFGDMEDKFFAGEEAPTNLTNYTNRNLRSWLKAAS